MFGCQKRVEEESFHYISGQHSTYLVQQGVEDQADLSLVFGTILKLDLHISRNPFTYIDFLKGESQILLCSRVLLEPTWDGAERSAGGLVVRPQPQPFPTIRTLSILHVYCWKKSTWCGNRTRCILKSALKNPMLRLILFEIYISHVLRLFVTFAPCQPITVLILELKIP